MDWQEAVTKNKQSVSLASIQAPIVEDLRVFRSYFKDAMKTDTWLLDQVIKYVLSQKGKQIRPTLVLLCARLFGEPTSKSYRAAALVELLHTATLIHDDVVDEADKRRGKWSINALWKNKIGVLLGDYLLSRGLLLALDHKDYTSLHILSDAVRRMAEGELLQIEKTRRLDIDQDTYYKIISDKTASLISACTACGGASTTDSEEAIATLKLLGEKLGLAFQIRDDLFDFGSDNVGKPLGIDLQEKKMTLPLIYSLKSSPPNEAKRVLRVVRKKRKSPADIKEVTHFVHKYGGIDFSRSEMNRLASEAMELLHQFDPSEARDALADLISYTVKRRH